jgi:hypothetical protein
LIDNPKIAESSELNTVIGSKRNMHQLNYKFDTPLPLNCTSVTHTTPTGSLAKFLQAGAEAKKEKSQV